jgi:hypothetical protein
MVRLRRFEIDELLVRPGTYFNPETEVLIVVDDSPEIDQATFDADAGADEADWVLVSDEAPIDEAARDELLQDFQARYRAAAAPDLDETEDEELDEDDEDELEPDEEPEEL